MKIILFASVFLVIFCLANAALFREGPNPKRRNGGCYTDNKNVGHLTAGQRKNIQGDCMEASCAGDGTITYASCGVVSAPSHCKIIEEKDKPYPECCPKVKKC